MTGGRTGRTVTMCHPDQAHHARSHRAVLCDIDGVLRHWPPSDALDLAHGLPAGALAAAAFAPRRLHPAITGAVPDAEWRAATAADLAHAYGPAARGAVTAWAALLPDVDRAAVALLAQARAAAPVALVSNATTRLEEDLARQGLADLADAVVNTARLGVAKPDPRVYHHAAARLGVPVEHCLFVDDTPANVEAAREVGMTAVHYQRLDDLRAALAPLCAAGA